MIHRNHNHWRPGTPDTDATAALREHGGWSMQCGLYKLIADSLVSPRVASQGDELLLLVELTAQGEGTAAPSDLTVELWRGDELRDRQQRAITKADRGSWTAAVRLSWGDRGAASSRLMCRVMLDGHEVFRRLLLIAELGVDAQGKLAPASDRPASAATMIAYERALAAQLGNRQLFLAVWDVVQE